MKLVYIYIICLLFVNESLFANERYIDSLLNSLSNSIVKSDSEYYSTYYNISYFSKDPKIKLKYSILAFEIGKNSNNSEWQINSKILESYSHIKIGMLDSAILVLHEALILCKRFNDSVGLATCYNALALAYKNNMEYILSEANYKKAIYQFTRNDELKMLAGAYLNLADLYRITKEYNESSNYLRKAEGIYDSIGFSYGIGYVQGNKGLIYVSQNELDSAKACLEKSISILEPSGDNYAVSSYLDGLAEIYYKEKDFVLAQQTAQKSFHLAKEHGLKEQIRDASLRLSEIHSQLGQHEEAYISHKQYVAYRDSINNEETIRKIANLRTEYEVAQKQKEVDQQKSQKELFLIIAVALVFILLLLLVLVVIMIKNNKNRNRLTRILEKQRKDLLLTNATKNKFFSVLSHDLRSPLATYNSYSEVIDYCIKNDELDKLSDISKELQSSSSNLLDLLDNLLQWGVNQMGTVKLVPGDVNVLEIITKEVSHLQNIANKKKIDIQIQVKPDTCLFVDRVIMAMAIRNIISNAIKFTLEGGKIDIVSHTLNGYTELKIRDTGVGMTEEQVAKLFNFNEVSSTYGTQNEKGVGLGLQLVYDFVKKSGAKIKVDSKLGEGTTFCLVFTK